eukprot:jgi/Botrbrau1/4201/Bobra.0044s0006.1
MQISTGQDGIQRLLAAETEAQQIVAKARKAKADRLKQAKAEAEKEIKAYKAQREEQYQKRIAEDSTNSGANIKRLEKEAGDAVAAVQANVTKNKQKVLDTLLGFVTDVQLVKS